MREREREGRKGESATKAEAGIERERREAPTDRRHPTFVLSLPAPSTGAGEPVLVVAEPEAPGSRMSRKQREYSTAQQCAASPVQLQVEPDSAPCSTTTCVSSCTFVPVEQVLFCTSQHCLLHAAEALLDGAGVRTAVADPHPTIITLFLARDYAIATLGPTRPPLARAWKALLLGAPAHKAACCRVRRQGEGVGVRLAFAGGRRVAVVGAEDAGVVGAVRAAY